MGPVNNVEISTGKRRTRCAVCMACDVNAAKASMPPTTFAVSGARCQAHRAIITSGRRNRSMAITIVMTQTARNAQ